MVLFAIRDAGDDVEGDSAAVIYGDLLAVLGWVCHAEDLELGIDLVSTPRGLDGRFRLDVCDLPERVLRSDTNDGEKAPMPLAATSMKPRVLVDSRPPTTSSPPTFSPPTFSDDGVRAAAGPLEGPSARPEVLASSLRERERQAILLALEGHGWNRTRASIALGIDRSTLYRKMIDLGLARHRDSA
jgi:hypothetical protein